MPSVIGLFLEHDKRFSQNSDLCHRRVLMTNTFPIEVKSLLFHTLIQFLSDLFSPIILLFRLYCNYDEWLEFLHYSLFFLS